MATPKGRRRTTQSRTPDETVVSGPAALVGRSHECSVIDTVLHDASVGRSSTVVLVGEPGIGKTALLRYARDTADAMRVVATSGHEATQGVPFGHLIDLEASLHPFVASLGEQHQRVFEVVLGHDATESGVDLSDRHTVGVALLELLAAAASAEPLLVVVDDAHWIDASTAGALAFAARRLVGDPIAILLGVREGMDTPLGECGRPVTVRGLHEWDATVLLGPGVDAAVAVELARATGGNPLALLSAADSLSDQQRQGRVVLDTPIGVGSVLEEAFAARVSNMPESVRRYLLLAAAEGPAGLNLLASAATQLGVDPAVALETATSAGLVVVVGSSVDFEHPLIRSAVYHRATPEDRRAAHEALAGVLRRGDDLSRRAYHLASASSEPDETTASVVESAADGASRRSAYAEAGAGYSRAASLSPNPDDAIRRTVSAARAHFLAGDVLRALDLVEQAIEATNDPLARADLLVTRMDLAVLGDRPIGNLSQVLTEAADTIATSDPARAATLLVTAAMPTMTTGRPDLMEAFTRRALELTAGTPFDPVVQLLLGLAQVFGGSESAALPELAAFGQAAVNSDSIPWATQLVAAVAQALAWADQLQPALSLLDRLVNECRLASTPAHLPQLLTNRAWVHFYAGAWSGALADGADALTLALETGQATAANYARLVLASVEGAQGRDAAREHATSAIAAFARVGALGLESCAHAVLGLLEQGAGRSDQAIFNFERAEELVSIGGPLHPMITSSAPELVEAYVRLGDRDSAEHWLHEATDRAESSGNVTARAQAARCRGLLATATDLDAHFEEALDLHVRSPRPFERARTELCFGERLRRDQRARQAIPHLQAAQDVLVRLEAMPWLRRCDGELRACGASTVSRADSRLSALTPQEIQVALVVAEGATNREAATTLFLSPRTVEFHLGSVYRKLGVNSRTQLALRLAETNLAERPAAE